MRSRRTKKDDDDIARYLREREHERLAFMDEPIAATIKRLLTEEWADPRIEYDRSKVH